MILSFSSLTNILYFPFISNIILLFTSSYKTSFNCSEINKDKFLILRHPFENIIVKLDKNSIKRTFISEFSTKKLKVTADFSNNHYLIEINEIVIGAIDCLDPNSKLNYRIEINDLEYEFLVVAIAIIIDVYCNNKKENI